MSYTILDGVAQGKPLDKVGLLRQALIAEIVAINGYSLHIAYSPIKEMNEIWRFIMGEEKKHYGMFLELIREYDPGQMEMYLKARKQVHIENTNLPCSALMPTNTYLNLVREDIKGENEAILLYEENVANIEDNNIREVYQSIILEEKHHIELLTAAMLQYDSQPFGPISR